MELKQMILTIVFGAVLSIQLVSVYSNTVEKCIDGLYQKKTPSAEGQGYVECLAWKHKSCCTAETTIKLKKHGDKDMAHFDWDHCGDLSQACKKYMTNEVCFYECEQPNLIKWAWSAGKGYIKGVPICSDYCDRWFEACKYDRTYSDNWFDDYKINNSKHGHIYVSTKCRTFAKIFENSEGLCNTLWGPTYKYEKTSNCMVMDFKGPNPNNKVTKTG